MAIARWLTGGYRFVLLSLAEILCHLAGKDGKSVWSIPEAKEEER